MVKNNLQIPCQKIITGGQTGVDRGALDACLFLRFQCGGWCPAGRLAEDGRIPDRYPLKETQETEYKYRTLRNVFDSDATLIISPGELQGGTLLTQKYTAEYYKSLKIVSSDNNVDLILNWLIENNVKVLNVAGPRLSEWPEAEMFAYRLIVSIVIEIKNRSAGCSLKR